MIKNPCFKCDNRNAECHIMCEKYKMYKSEREELLRKKREIEREEIILHKIMNKERRKRIL